MREQGRAVVVSPMTTAHAGIAALDARKKLSPKVGLLFVGPASEILPAAVGAARSIPGVPVGAAVATDSLAIQIASPEMPTPLLADTLKGLVPLSLEDGRILDVVAARPSTAPLLRSAFEGVLYYLLEARAETRGVFRTNVRIRHANGGGADEVDLVAEEAKLAIEIDGGQHKAWDHTRRDEQKDARLRGIGYEVIRFEARDVATRPTDVWKRVHQMLGQRGNT